MDDEAILDLYWDKNESAIRETEKKYGAYCRSIAFHILRDKADTEETLNDTWMKTWDAIPPQRPNVFSVWLGTVTRNLSINRLRRADAKKRKAHRLELSYEELQECVPDQNSLEDRITAGELGALLDTFLRQIPLKDRCVFLRRYWYMDTGREIAHRYHMTEAGVKSNLHRTRVKLKDFLQKEGYEL